MTIERRTARRATRIGALSGVAALTLWAMSAYGSGAGGAGSVLAADQKPLRAAAINPTITTTPGPNTTVPVGTALTDSATLTGASGTPTGQIQFLLYDPAGTAAGCLPTYAGGTPVYNSGNLNLTNGVADTTGSANPAPVANTPGTWSWVVNYGGDGTYNSFTQPGSGCSGEQVTVQQLNPTITTTTGPNNPTLGTTLTDSATLTGAAGTPTGLVQFLLYDPAGTAAGCVPKYAGGTPVYDSGNLTLTNGVADTSASANTPPVANTPGTWSWVVNYGGDSTYNSFTEPGTGCSGEQVTIARATPTVDTTQTPASAVTGSTLSDSATVSGGFNPTGTVTFELFAPGDPTCSGTPVFTRDVALQGGTASVTSPTPAGAAGTWHWVATYNGDTNNNSASSGCGEPVKLVAPASPPQPQSEPFHHHHASCTASRDPNPNCGG